MQLVRLAVPLLVATSLSALAQPGLSSPTIYTGMCDASAAVALDSDHFAVANDEDNILRIYSRSRPGAPTSVISLSEFLQVTKKSPETDLEGAARVGNRVYWITSHGRNASGKESPNRQRFFATDIITNNQAVTLVPAGSPYKSLLRDLMAEPKLQRFGLAKAAELPVKERGALNIEGLTLTPEGHLLIGFRSPNPDGKALLVPLLNPEALLEGKTASFGEPILLDLGGLGIRSLDLDQGNYLIVAGHYGDVVASRLYLWRGKGSRPRWVKGIDLSDLNPEGILSFGETNGQFQIVSDDGGVSVGGKACKDLKDPNQKRFRSYVVRIDGL